MTEKQTNITSQQSPLLNPARFQHLLLLAIVFFSTIWLVDAASGIITTFDAIAYPICLACFLILYFLSVANKISASLLHMVTYFIIAGYLTSTSIWHHAATNGLFSNAAQWLGLNYVIVYLFLEIKKAASITIIVFTVTIVGHFAVLIQHYSINDTMGVVLNIGIAHIVYIVLLWTVIKLRTDNDKVQEKVATLENYAYVDILTHVLNRRGIEKVFQELNVDTKQKLQNYTILILDIDYFKQINDQYGHLIGDQVLAKLASTLSRKVHTKDVLGRWGGEEFIILSMDKNRQEALEYAAYLCSLIKNLNFNAIPGITVSIGIGYSHEADIITNVFNIADNNLYAAKKTGRNKVMDSQLAKDLSNDDQS